MLDEEFERPEETDSSGVGVVGIKSKAFNGPSQAINFLGEVATCGSLVSENKAKVDATSFALHASDNKCETESTTHSKVDDLAGVIAVEAQIKENEGPGEESNESKLEAGFETVSLVVDLNKGCVMTEDHERFNSVGGSFDQDDLAEKNLEATGSTSEYNSLTGRDTDDDDSSCGGSPSKYYQALSKTNSNCEQFFSNSDDDITFGVNDWAEYLHETGSGMCSLLELQESKQDLHSKLGPLSTNATEGLEVMRLHGAEHENKSDNDVVPDEIPQVRGAGRLDLDDGDGDDDLSAFEGESFVTAPLSIATNSLGIRSSCGSRMSLLDEDVNLDDHSDVWGLTSSANLGLSEATDNALVRGNEHAEVQSSEDLKFLPSQEGMRVEEQLFELEEVTEGDKSRLLVGVCAGHVPKADFKADLPARTPEVKSVTQIARDIELVGEANAERNRDMPQFEVFQGLTGEYDIEADFTSDMHARTRNRGRVLHLDSQEAEQLLQIDTLGVERSMSSTTGSLKGSSEDESKRPGVGWAAEDLGPDELSRYVEALEVKETYIDTVLDMEDVLFDGEGGGGARSFQGLKLMSPGSARPVRDGSLSATTSNASSFASKQVDYSACLTSDLEWVEVVGASQRRGGASLGERVVGVKQHTVYRIKVMGGGNVWEIQRRYRDFVVLYNQLQSLFVFNKKITLPPPWERVKQESRKYFGNTSPDVVEARSDLIQVCLQSLIKAGPPLSAATPLLRFLFPVGDVSLITGSGSGLSGKNTLQDQLSESTLPLQEFGLDSPKSETSSYTADQDDDGTHSSVLGKTIRLIVQIHKKKSLKQQLQAQHFTCAGCYKHLQLAFGLVPELVQNWGWGGPRLCEYSGQLFCSTCHLNETAVLPAWVLQRWDFTPRLVSQLAKAYLDSIYDKPMLCVSAVNPYLYARVPVLAHLTEIRRKVNKMLAYIRCPARTRIQTMLGSRRYLLENNDFCALRDLVDLSKGAFAVLPGYMRAILIKLSSHITRECFTCRELGEACGAGDLCDDPYDVIYPHQDDLIVRCPSCQHPFHKACFRKFHKCPSCTGHSEQRPTDSRLNSEQSRVHDTTPFGPGMSSFQQLESKDSLFATPATPTENKVSAKRNLLPSFVGSKEAWSSDHENEFLNMNPLSSPIDL